MTSILELAGKKAFILGLGISGTSAAIYLINEGCRVYGSDDNLNRLPESKIHDLENTGVTLVAPDRVLLGDIDILIVSPGVPRDHSHYIEAKKRGILILGEAELALQKIALKYPCIGITGTNGKTTVTLLTEHLLKSLGIKSLALGNSGTPLSSLLYSDVLTAENVDVVVVELSSFQLETLHGKVLDAAILLNITEDHLDRYASFDEYIATKKHLFKCVKEGGVSFIEEKCYNAYSEIFDNDICRYGENSQSTCYTDGKSIFFHENEIVTLPEYLKGRYDHDVENILAACAMVCAIVSSGKWGISFLSAKSDDFNHALAAFKKPPHRLQFVCDINGVSYIDDSKATNVDAVVRALEATNGQVILIAGGVDKGGSYTPWIQAFVGKVRIVLTIGASAEKINNELSSHVAISHFEKLSDAIAYAAMCARPGETVLLSPGCSSYDMFESYRHRGLCFQEIVHALSYEGGLI